MENFALIALAHALENAAEGMVVRRVVQHHDRGFVLQARSVRIPGLKVLLEPGSPLLYVSGARPLANGVTTEFLMILRKHLNGARLTKIHKPLSERIVELWFKTTLPAKELESVRLILELFPNAPNLFLLDANGRTLAAMTPPGQKRGFEEYGTYEYPMTRKMALDSALDADPSWFDETAFLASPDYLIRTVAGIGPVLSNEIAFQHAARGRSPLEALADIVHRSQNPGPTSWVYSEAPISLILRENDLARLRRVVISPIELESLRGSHSSQTYPTILEATGAVFDELESRTLLAKAKAPLIRQIRSRKQRIGTRRTRLVARQRRFNEALDLRKIGQLLTASGADMDRRHETIEVTDYFADRPGTRLIQLDGSKTLRENVARMFKQCRKAERGLTVVDKQLQDAATMEKRLEDQERRVASIGDWDAWLSRPEAAKPANPDPKRVDSHAPGGRRRRSSLWIDGHEVLVGRSARENDELTFRVATGDDFWFHVADYTGAHVIVRNPNRADRLDETVLLRAAELAAYHSQARNSQKVDVHYTRRKFVAKPRKAKPGLVRLREFETIAVEPRDWKTPEPSPEEPLGETPLKR